jgi:predicted CXXCH cytochrome family protein
MRASHSKRHLLVAAAFAFAAAGCVSDDETGTNPTRDVSFLGYSSPETKQTTCGNCHPSEQAKWAQTKHATAWADLQASGHAEPACSRCHTVNGLTNGVGDSTGFFAVSADARHFYQDVQCESCHGTGARHVSAPDETQPIPTMLVDSNLADGCASCHNSARHPFAEQFQASGHGQMESWHGSTCQNICHNGNGAIQVWAPRGRFRESRPPITVSTTGLAAQPLTCSVCHDPHDAGTPGQTRMSLTSPDSTQNLCYRCHNRRAEAPLTSSSGPHSAQGGVLFGTAGWAPASWNISGPARHGTMEGTCATCHMNAAPVNTSAGAFAVQNTGHTFKAIPCLDPALGSTGGVDTAGACADEARDFSACATSNCHGSQASARSAMRLLQDEIRRYGAVLWVDKNGNDTLNAAPTDSGWVPLLLQRDSALVGAAKQFSTSDAVITPAEGGRFNVQLALTAGHMDGSFGVHNPGYMRALMQRTIAAMRTAYPTLPAAPAAIRAAITRAEASRR